MGILRPSSPQKSKEELIGLWNDAQIKFSKQVIFGAKLTLPQLFASLTALVHYPEASPGRVILEFCTSGMAKILKSRKERFFNDSDPNQFIIDNLWMLAGLINFRSVNETIRIADPEQQRIKLVEMMEQGRPSGFGRLLLPRFDLSASFGRVNSAFATEDNYITSLIITPLQHRRYTDRNGILNLAEDLRRSFFVNLSPIRVKNLMQQMQELI